MSSCYYFDSDEWKRRVWSAVRSWDVGSFTETIEDERAGSILAQLASNRHDVTVERTASEDEIYAGDIEIGRALTICEGQLGVNRREVVRLWQESEFKGPELDTHLFDLECPHAVFNHERYSGEYCIFHCSPSRLDELDVGLGAESTALAECIRDSLPETNRFLGARFRQFGVPHLVYDSENRYPIDLRLSVIEDARMNDVRVTNTVLFSHATFNSDAFFCESVFQGLSFEDVRFDGETKIKETVIRGKANFNGAVFASGEEPTIFNQSVFGQRALFRDVVFTTPVKFNRTEFGGPVEFLDSAWFIRKGVFTGTEFAEYTYFNQAVFERRANFSGASFEKNVGFEDVIFNRRATFTQTVFTESGVFNRSRFTSKANFTDAVFSRGAQFEEVEFRGPALFEAAKFADTVSFDPDCAREGLNFSESELSNGTVARENDEVAFYRFDHATIGEVDFEPKNKPDLFRNIHFKATDFEGFRFSDHLEAISSDWNLHRDTFSQEEPSGSLLRPRSWARSFVTQNRGAYAMIESTYLRAKNGATETGDDKVAQEFFIRERKYRRKKQANIAFNGATESEIATGDRLNQLGGWLVSWFYNLTCGYGERPLRTVLASGSVIILFALMYQLFRIPIPGSETTGGYISFSIQTFVSFLIGSTSSTYEVGVRLLTAVEAFVGAFFIALFVFTLTRSIKR